VWLKSYRRLGNNYLPLLDQHYRSRTRCGRARPAGRGRPRGAAVRPMPCRARGWPGSAR
jgi:hypothetical protein